MVADVEPHEVIAQHAVQEFLLPRANTENLRAGPRNVPKLAGDYIRFGISDEAGQQGEVIVLGEYRSWPTW